MLNNDDDVDVLHVYIVNNEECDNDDDAFTLLTDNRIITFINVIIDKINNLCILNIYL